MGVFLDWFVVVAPTIYGLVSFGAGMRAIASQHHKKAWTIIAGAGLLIGALTFWQQHQARVDHQSEMDKASENFSHLSSQFDDQKKQIASLLEKSAGQSEQLTRLGQQNSDLSASLDRIVTAAHMQPGGSYADVANEIIKRLPKERPAVVMKGNGNAYSDHQSGGITAGTVNIAPPQRHLSSPDGQALENQILREMPRDKKISVECPMGDSESCQLAAEILSFMKENGFSNVNGVSQGVFMPVPPKGLQLQKDKGGDSLTFIVGAPQ